MIEHSRTRRTDPITSWLAADSVKLAAKEHATKIVNCLFDFGPLGKDGIAARTGLDGNQVARRLSELQKDDYICLTGEFVKSKSGRMEREWMIKPVGGKYK